MAHKNKYKVNAFVHTTICNSLNKQKGGDRFSEDVSQVMMQSTVLSSQKSPFFSKEYESSCDTVCANALAAQELAWPHSLEKVVDPAPKLENTGNSSVFTDFASWLLAPYALVSHPRNLSNKPVYLHRVSFPGSSVQCQFDR